MSKFVSYFVLALSLVCFSGACAEQKGRKKKDDEADKKDADKKPDKNKKEDKK